MRCQLTHRPNAPTLAELDEAGPDGPATSRFTSRLHSGNPPLTGQPDSSAMRLLAVVVLVLSLAASAAGATRLGAGQPGIPNFPKLPGKWSHADINITVKKVPHTLTLDRGRIIQITTTQMTLREADGTTQVIPLTPTAIVMILGRPATIYDLRKKEQVETMRIDGGPAVRIRVTSKA